MVAVLYLSGAVVCQNTHHYQETPQHGKKLPQTNKYLGKITYHSVTHLATKHQNANLETNRTHSTTKTKNINSVKN
jgi:hypothetical protein